MKRLGMLLLALSLSLPGCAVRDIAGPAVGVAAALLGSARAPAGAVQIDASKLTAANRLAQSAYETADLAGLAGRIAPSTSPDAARDNFCEMVVLEVAVVTDDGGRIMQLRCLMDHHLDRAKAALDARDAATYAEHLAKADNFTNQLRALVSASLTRTP